MQPDRPQGQRRQGWAGVGVGLRAGVDKGKNELVSGTTSKMDNRVGYSRGMGFLYRDFAVALRGQHCF